MRRVLLLVGLLVAAAARADTELVLEDGQVLTGVELRKQGKDYVLVLESGKELTVPVDRVEEVRRVPVEDGPQSGLTPAVSTTLAGDEPTGPSGLRVEAPQVLAGEKLVPPQIAEQLEVLGPPARFRIGPIDPYWAPQSAYSNDPALNNFAPSRWARSVIDPKWWLVSAFGDEDVLRPGHSAWRKGVIDPYWVPDDSFARKKADWARARGESGGEAAAIVQPAGGGQRRAIYAGDPARLSPVRFSFTPVAAPPRGDPRECADRLFGELAGRRPQVQAIVDGRYLALPIRLHEATLAPTLEDADDGVRAIFTVDQGQCRLIGGDLDPLLGEPLSHAQAVARAVVEYNAALETGEVLRLATPRDKIRYAFSVSTLLDPDVSGYRRAGRTLLETADQLRALAAVVPGECSQDPAVRSYETRAAVAKFKPPETVGGAAGEVVRFFTWSERGGTVEHYAMRLAEDGKVSVDRETVARHLGQHQDP